MIRNIRCIAIDDEPMALSIISNFCNRRGGIELSVYTDALEAMAQIEETVPELIFLDIEMESANGLDIARQLPKSCVTIFTTAYAQYALDGYDLGVVDFLHKPFSYSRFETAVNKASAVIEYIRSLPKNQTITVKEDYINVPIPISEIVYIEAMNNYCRIFRTNNICTQTRCTLKSLIEMLPYKDFIRIHRSFVVAADKINGFTKKEITMIKKMHKKKLPRTIMACSCIAMLCINIFAWNFSSISLMLVAAAVSLTIFILHGAPEQKGGAKK